MKQFKLDMTAWTVTVRKPDMSSDVPRLMGAEEEYPFRNNLSEWLRAGGVFKTGEEIVEAVTLGKRLIREEGDESILDEREADILKKCFNIHIGASAGGKTATPLGGAIHEEAILRVFGMEEVK